MRPHLVQGDYFETEVGLGDVIVYNRFLYSGFRSSDRGSWMPYAIVRFVKKTEVCALSWPAHACKYLSGIQVTRTEQGMCRAQSEATEGPRVNQRFTDYGMKGLIADETERQRERLQEHFRSTNTTSNMSSVNSTSTSTITYMSSASSGCSCSSSSSSGGCSCSSKQQ